MSEKTREKIIDTIQKHGLFSKGDTIVVGVSGGADSMCLLHVLIDISKSMDLTLEAVHVNHKFRPGAAERDQRYVEDFCKSNGVRCWTFEKNCNKIAKEESMTPEEAGRKARYDSFVSVAQGLIEEGTANGKIRIAIAQNLNDQAETLLFRIIRGTGTDGLAGIDYLRKDRTGFIIVRPLLDVDRQGIEDYCESNKIEYRHDKTNDERIYTRNKIRLDLIPYLKKKFNMNIIESLNRLCRVTREDKSYIWNQASKAFDEMFIGCIDGVCSLNKEALRECPDAIKNRIIIKAFEKVGLYKDISFVHLEAASKLIEKEHASAQIDFPGGFIMRISYGKVEFLSSDNEQKEIKCKLKARILYKDDYEPEEGTAAFDVDKMAEVYDFAGGPLNLILARSREPGDYIDLSVGQKSIQDLFVDMKIQKELRESIFMAAIGNEILWIPEGISRARYSHNYQVNPDTKRVLILEMECEAW